MATFYLGPTDAFVHATLSVLRNTAHSGFTAYFGLVIAGPSASDGTGTTELSTVDYTTRVACGFSAPASRQMANAGALTLIASSTVAWNGGAAISRFGIWSAPTGGTLWWVEQISPVLIVAGAGVPVVIPASALILRSLARSGVE